MASKGQSAGLSGYPTMQLRTHRHGPRTRPRHPRPSSLTTPQSRRRAASASRAGPSVAGLGLQPGERTLRAEAPLSAAPSPAGLTGYSAERTKRGRPSARRGLDHFRATASGPPTIPIRGHSFEIPALHRQAAVPTAGPGSAPASRCTPPSLAGDPPKLGWGWITALTSSRRRDLLPLSSAEAGAALSSELGSGKTPQSGAQQ